MKTGESQEEDFPIESLESDRYGYISERRELTADKKSHEVFIEKELTEIKTEEVKEEAVSEKPEA